MKAISPKQKKKQASKLSQMYVVDKKGVRSRKKKGWKTDFPGRLGKRSIQRNPQNEMHRRLSSAIKLCHMAVAGGLWQQEKYSQ